MRSFAHTSLLIVLLFAAATSLAQVNFKAQNYFQKIDNPRKVTHADLNGDGRQDIVVINDFKFSVLLNSGSGFSEVVHHKVSFLPIALLDAADYDGDNDVDIALVSHDSVFILFNN